MDKRNTNQDRPRRKPGASAKRPPQKAPNYKPRKNPAVHPEPTRVPPEVVYMAPKPFRRNRLILHLATIVAVVLALLVGLSIFFKVEKIEVSGCVKYTPWQVQQASGIEEGDQLLTFSVPQAAWRIRDELRYVKDVRIGISLPDTVVIEIVETHVTYALADANGKWWLMDAQGKILEECAAGQEESHTVITGVTLDAPVPGKQAMALENTTPPTDANGESVPVTVTAAQRLAAAIEIAELLERNGIIGQAESMDVANVFDIRLQYLDKFRVLLGDSGELDKKIMYLKGFLDDYGQNRPYEKGTLYLSDPEWIEYKSDLEEE